MSGRYGKPSVEIADRRIQFEYPGRIEIPVIDRDRILVFIAATQAVGLPARATHIACTVTTPNLASTVADITDHLR